MFGLIVREISVFDSKQWWAELVGRGEYKDAGRIVNNFFYEFHLLHGLNTGLNEGGPLGIESKFVDEALHMVQLHLLTLELSLLAISVLDP